MIRVSATDLVGKKVRFKDPDTGEQVRGEVIRPHDDDPNYYMVGTGPGSLLRAVPRGALHIVWDEEKKMARYVPFTKTAMDPELRSETDAAVEQLAVGIERLMESRRFEDLDDPFREVHIWVGSDIDKYAEHGGDLVVAFCEGGYDQFAAMADFGPGPLRAPLLELAESLGFRWDETYGCMLHFRYV